MSMREVIGAGFSICIALRRIGSISRAFRSRPVWTITPYTGAHASATMTAGPFRSADGGARAHLLQEALLLSEASSHSPSFITAPPHLSLLAGCSQHAQSSTYNPLLKVSIYGVQVVSYSAMTVSFYAHNALLRFPA